MARVAAEGKAPAAYLALGDSYTIGEGVEDADRWPVRLAAALRERGTLVTAPQSIAASGWTTDDLSAAMDAEQEQGSLLPAYGLVSLLIGANNQYRERSVDEYAKHYAALLDRAISLAGGAPSHVLAVSIPDWGLTPYAQASGRDRKTIGREIDEYNSIAAHFCEQREVTWVDITDLTRRTEGNDMLVADGLHPSPEMYRLWVERILAAMPV